MTKSYTNIGHNVACEVEENISCQLIDFNNALLSQMCTVLWFLDTMASK